MEIIIECNCGKPLEIVSKDILSTGVVFIVEECPECEKINYEAGEADAKQ